MVRLGRTSLLLVVLASVERERCWFLFEVLEIGLDERKGRLVDDRACGNKTETWMWLEVTKRPIVVNCLSRLNMRAGSMTRRSTRGVCSEGTDLFMFASLRGLGPSEGQYVSFTAFQH